MCLYRHEMGDITYLIMVCWSLVLVAAACLVFHLK